MTKYVCLVKLRLESFMAWKLEHIPRGSNEKADCHTPIPGPTRMEESNRVWGARLYTGTH